MNPILKNILAVIVGVVAGSLINMGLIQIGYSVLPIEGIDPNDMEALAEAMPSLGFKHFIFPFLGHALGTLGGAIVAALIAANSKMLFALVIGGLFFAGGIYASYLLDGPTWFVVTDLVLAYFPMAWMGGKLVR